MAKPRRDKYGRYLSRARSKKPLPPLRDKSGRYVSKAKIKALPRKERLDALSSDWRRRRKLLEELGLTRLAKGQRLRIHKKDLTPTKRGFSAAEDAVRKVVRESLRRKEEIPTVTYDLTVRTKKGNEVHVPAIAIPRPQDVKRRKGESKSAAMTRAVMEEIRHTVFGELSNVRHYRWETGLQTLTPETAWMAGLGAEDLASYEIEFYEEM